MASAHHRAGVLNEVHGTQQSQEPGKIAERIEERVTLNGNHHRVSLDNGALHPDKGVVNISHAEVGPRKAT